MRRMYSENQLVNTVEEVASKDGIKIFENIIDKDGHKRFIEGNITIETIEGVSQKYGKWSLSGTHLMIVVGGEVSQGTTFGPFTLAKIYVPQWILDKIYPVFLNIIEGKTLYLSGEDYSSQNVYLLFEKSSNFLRLYTNNTISVDKKRFFRISFDLLIDNE